MGPGRPARDNVIDDSATAYSTASQSTRALGSGVLFLEGFLLENKEVDCRCCGSGRAPPPPPPLLLQRRTEVCAFDQQTRIGMDCPCTWRQQQQHRAQQQQYIQTTSNNNMTNVRQTSMPPPLPLPLPHTVPRSIGSARREHAIPPAGSNAPHPTNCFVLTLCSLGPPHTAGSISIIRLRQI